MQVLGNLQNIIPRKEWWNIVKIILESETFDDLFIQPKI